MTWEEFLESDLTLEDYVRNEVDQALTSIQPQLDQAFERMRVDTAAAEQSTAECEFDRLVRENAVLGGVLPRAVKYIAADAKALFEVRENALVIRNGETHPGDPLTPLTFDVWLQEVRERMGFLFVAK